MRHNLFEFLLGAFVLCVAIFIGAYAFIYNRDSVAESYSLTAHFGRINGIISGSEVKLAGVKIGRVADSYLDSSDFSSVLLLEIDSSISLPANVIASIASEGLLGKNFVRIEVPRGDRVSEFLSDGGRISQTDDPTSLEDLLGRALFLIGGESER